MTDAPRARFEWARRTGSSLVWTEDWCSDAEAHRWSFFASRMRSAIALRAADAGLPQLEFGGYIVPRSGGDQDGGLMRRVLSLVGGGAKGFRYFTFVSNTTASLPNTNLVLRILIDLRSQLLTCSLLPARCCLATGTGVCESWKRLL
jgi:hypothetical protein